MPYTVSFTAIRSNRRRAPSKKTRKALDKFTGDFMVSVLSEVIYYPPVPPNSRYTRTKDLLRGWSLKNTSRGNGVSWEIRNKMWYTRLVHGNSFGERQWPIHAQHGWKNLGVVMQQLGGRGRFHAGAQAIIDGNLNGY